MIEPSALITSIYNRITPYSPTHLKHETVKYVSTQGAVAVESIVKLYDNRANIIDDKPHNVDVKV